MPSTTPTNALSISAQGSLTLAGAEISAFDPGSDRLFVTSGSGLQVVDLSDPSAPTLIETIDFTTRGFATTDVTSVAASGGLIAVALPNADKAQNGQIVFLDAATGTVLRAVPVGALPDSVTFTPDGSKLLVANEGEYLTDGSPGGPGTVSIIDLAGGVAAATVTTADFTAFDGQEDALRAEGVRIFPGRSVSVDVEPEYVAIAADGLTALVTLQEANAVAILDIETATFTDIVALGTKDFSTLLADFSDRDGPGGIAAVNLETGNPVFGLYMPDAIDAYSAGGADYFITANEGDDRNDFLNPDEVVRLNSSSYDLDDTLFPNEATLKLDSELGRLNVVNLPGLRGDTDGDGDIDQIQTLGGRSFSILDATGAIVFDSADLIERITVDLVAQGVLTAAVFDDRSDNKGPEPEGVEIATIGDATYAFIGLERANVNLVFDVTDPNDVSYTGFAARAGDVSPEGGLFISAADSPTGEALFVASNEVSNTITVFQVEEPPMSETFTLQILHGSDFEGQGIQTGRAENFAAIVDTLEDAFANSITLSSGDNVIPGPVTAAGTDPSVRDEIASFYEQLLGLPANSLSGIRNGVTPFNAADIAVLNAIGIEASVFGNHDFDLGPTALAGAIDFVASLPAAPTAATLANITSIGALFPYISANLDFSAESSLAGLFTPELREASSYGTTAAELSTDAGIRAEATAREIAPWTVITEGGEQVGVLGLTTQLLASISTVGNVRLQDPFGDGGVDNTDELAAILQPFLDQMAAQGINKIVLLTHLQQIANERSLATKLSGVDIIIGGGSSTLFADETDVIEPGDVVGGDYPEVYTSAVDGGTVLLVNNTDYAQYVGRLVVEFDENGAIILDSLDPDVSGVYTTTEAGVDAVAGNGDGVIDAAEDAAIFADGTRGGEVRQISDAIQAVINVKDGNVVGFTDVFLEGRRNFVRSEETNLGNLTADANLAVAKSFDLSTVISLKNGGGIRAEIGTLSDDATPVPLPPQANPDSGKPEGGISQLDIENSLRFNNALSLATLTAQGIKNLLENAVRAVAPGATPGAFPQIAGLEFSFDPTRASLDRVLDVAVVNQAGEIIRVIAENGVVIDPTLEFRIATLGFLLPDNAADNDGGDQIIVKGAVVSDTGAGNVSGTLAVFSDFAALDRVDLNEIVATPDFETIGREQSAFADYLSSIYGTADTAFGDAETPRSLDERTQNLSQRVEDVVGDRVAGAVNDDVVVGTAADDKVFARRGDDQVYGVEGDDTFLGGSGDDLLVGGAGDDLLRGNAGDDTLFGGDGDDEFSGNQGADLLTGGAGADRFRFNVVRFNDTITDFATGEDKIVVKDADFADFQALLDATVDTADGALITLGEDSFLTLAGITEAQLVADDFLI